MSKREFEPTPQLRTTYGTDIVLGEKYVDTQTGVEGIATSIIFFQHGCERVGMETVKDGAIKDYSFDAPRLRSVKTGAQATSERTGGSRPGPSPASSPGR